MESERKVQHYWETVEESLPIGSKEAEHANWLCWDSYWRRIEVQEALKKPVSKWNQRIKILIGMNKESLLF